MLSLNNIDVVPRVFVPYCANVTKHAALKYTFTGSILIDHNSNPMSRNRTPGTWAIQLQMCQLHMSCVTRSLISSDSPSELCRVAHLLTAEQGKQRLCKSWQCFCIELSYNRLNWCTHDWKITILFAYKC